MPLSAATEAEATVSTSEQAGPPVRLRADVPSSGKALATTSSATATQEDVADNLDRSVRTYVKLNTSLCTFVGLMNSYEFCTHCCSLSNTVGVQSSCHFELTCNLASSLHLIEV